MPLRCAAERARIDAFFSFIALAGVALGIFYIYMS